VVYLKKFESKNQLKTPQSHQRKTEIKALWVFYLSMGTLNCTGCGHFKMYRPALALFGSFPDSDYIKN